MSQLPVFPVLAEPVSPARLMELGKNLFDIGDHRVEEAGRRLLLRSGSHVVDVNRLSGGVWAADEADLWNPDRTPQLPDDDRARAMAEDMLAGSSMAPRFATKDPFRVEFTTMGRTLAAISVDKRRPQVKSLDVQANFAVKVVLGDGEEVPVVGGGGEFKVTLGEGGRLIGASGVWRPVVGAPLFSRMLDQAESDRAFRQRTKDLEIESFDSFLAYYAAPTPSVQTMLYPVRVYRASAVFDRELVPLRLITLPASDFGPFPKPQLPQRPRPPRDIRPPKSGPDEQPRARRSIVTAATDPFEAGTSWIGESGGLTGSKKNAQGFVDGLQSDGWNVNFNWGDKNAFESDWRANDDVWVDNADFVFYTGHASMNGWVLAKPDDTLLHFNEIGGSPGNPGDLWGQQDLEWVIVAACGPLQDDLLSAGGGSATNRWDGAFDGLHTLMGYGAVTYDNEDEGKTVVAYARGGTPIIDAWFRTAQEIQPATNSSSAPDGPTIWVGAMYAFKSGTTSPRNDHLWGHGSVAPDPTSPNVKVCMWTTC
ncbi:MAG TPA: DUF6345 domain-containing protein [Acidimicrobiales bacterium]|nr:DUF6345 domain-containing protein [Acidimicrobiales bacterium]